jgi:hypothetical protein
MFGYLLTDHPMLAQLYLPEYIRTTTHLIQSNLDILTTHPSRPRTTRKNGFRPLTAPSDTSSPTPRPRLEPIAHRHPHSTPTGTRRPTDISLHEPLSNFRRRGIHFLFILLINH